MDTLCKKLLLLSMAIALGQSVWSQEKVSKKITKTFTMTDAGELHLDNKYGDVTITGWNRNSIAVTVDITVTHKKKENAESLLARIKTNITHTNDFVTIRSEITEKSSGFFSKLFDKANPFDFDRSNVQIDYTIQLPSHAALDITNKFGDIIIGDWNGKLRAGIQHGDVWVNEDLTNADIDVEFGKLRTRSIEYANIRMKNGGIDLEDSENLRINSSGSDIKINKVSSLKIYSSKDEITIQEIGTMEGDLKFSNAQLNLIDKGTDLTMKITDFKVAKISGAGTIINLRQESSEISLNIKDFGFTLDATLEEGLLRLPKSFKNIDTKMLDNGKRIREIKAEYGKNTSGKISIRGKKGVILLKEL